VAAAARRVCGRCEALIEPGAAVLPGAALLREAGWRAIDCQPCHVNHMTRRRPRLVLWPRNVDQRPLIMYTNVT
jgi:hypothetical protein